MINEQTEKQKELFEEFEKPKKGLKLFRDNNRLLQSKTFFLQFSIEKLTALLIAILVVIIAVFCAGVERGKHIAIYGRNLATTAPPKSEPQPQEAIQAKPVSAPAAQPAEAAPAGQKYGGVYVVRLATCANKSSALKIVDKIKKQGLPAYAAVSGRFFMVCVGDYKDKKQAEAAYSILKKDYKDCYIKTIKR